MYHFFVPDADGPVISIRGGDVNHIRNVLRMKAGDRIVVSNGSDRDFYCVIREIRRDEVIAEVCPEEVEESELPANLILYQGLPKGTKMELIVQKAVELGAVRIVPVAMRRSVTRLDEKKQKTKIPRWNSIAESAARQSGRRIIPEVTRAMSWQEAVQEASRLDRILVPYENARGMSGTLQALRELKTGQDIGIFIGPEGGFEPSEIQVLKDAGAAVISLGNRILRTETAGMTALSLCMARLECEAEEGAASADDIGMKRVFASNRDGGKKALTPTGDGEKNASASADDSDTQRVFASNGDGGKKAMESTGDSDTKRNFAAAEEGSAEKDSAATEREQTS